MLGSSVSVTAMFKNRLLKTEQSTDLLHNKYSQITANYCTILFSNHKHSMFSLFKYTIKIIFQ